MVCERVQRSVLDYQRSLSYLLLAALEHDEFNIVGNRNNLTLPLTDVELGPKLSTTMLLGHLIHMVKWGCSLRCICHSYSIPTSGC